jgi:hypothetical protein
MQNSGSSTFVMGKKSWGGTGWLVPPLNHSKTLSFSARNNIAAESINIDGNTL